MKVVYISNSIIPSKQANSIHVMKMAYALSNNGLETTLIGRDGFKQPSNDYKFYGVEEKFKIIKLPWLQKIGSLTYSILAFFKVKKINPDIVYGRCLIGIYFSTLFGFSTMYEAHAPFYNQNILRRFIFKRLIKLKQFKGLVVISEALKNIFLETEDIESHKIFVEHDASDIVDLQNSIELGKDNRLKIGYVGHLYSGRGVDIIIELATLLKDFDFHIVGGNIEDINYWKSKVNLDNIIFHGHLPPSEVYKYRNSFDILLAPYQDSVSIEGKNDTSKFMSPLKIFEYMSSKKPIISSDLPVLREVLSEENSILVTHNNIDLWSSAINKLKKQNEREKLAVKAYEDFILKYTWNIRAQNIIERF